MLSATAVTSKRMNLRKLPAFYKNVSVMANVGITLDSIFLNLSKTESDIVHREQLKLISASLKFGKNLAGTFEKIKILPDYDIELLRASVEMGRIPQVTKALAQNYEELNKSLGEIKGKMFNPVFTIILAVLLGSFGDLFSGKLSLLQYLGAIFPELLMIVFIFGAFFMTWRQSQYSKQYRNYLYSILDYIPGLNSFILTLAIDRFSSTLELALETGLDLFQSLNLASESAGLEKIRLATKRLVPMIQQGVDIESALKIENVFPKEFVIAINVGMQSGNIPESIHHYRKRLALEIETSRNRIVKIIPTIVQIFVVLYVASHLISFYGGRLSGI